VARWSDLVNPPGLQSERSDTGRSSTWLELFFDLAFILVVAELAGALAGDLTLAGLAKFGALFAVSWWGWAGYTIYANRFDTDDVVYRLGKCLAMLAVAGMAASAAEGTGQDAPTFALSYGALSLILVALYARAYRHVGEARKVVAVYMAADGLGGLLWLASAFVGGPGRYVLWGIGLAVQLAAPILASLRPDAMPLQVEHLPERFGLFVILVLAESVAAVAHGVHDTEWEPAALATATAGFVVAVGLWWLYFDLAGASAKQLLHDRSDQRGSFAHDVYVYGQLPVAAGMAMVGVGIEHAILESAEAGLGAGTRLALSGGAALSLAALALIQIGIARSWRAGLPWPGAGAVLAAALGLAAGAFVPALGMAALAVVMVVVVVAGIAKEREGSLDTASSPR
jgi:low temperature requirement protein LtrA